METNNQKKPRAKISMQTRIVNLTDKVVSLTDKLAAVGRAKNGVEDERDKFARAVEDVNNIAVDKIRKLEDELEMVLSAVENLSEGFAKRGAELETAKKKFDFPDSKRCREIAKDLITKDPKKTAWIFWYGWMDEITVSEKAKADLAYIDKQFTCPCDSQPSGCGDNPKDLCRLKKIVTGRWHPVLTPELEEYKKALEDLYNEQNGPPLIRREKHWQAAYDKAGELLTPEPEPKKPIIPCPDCPKDGTLKEIWSHPDEDHWDNE